MLTSVNITITTDTRIVIIVLKLSFRPFYKCLITLHLLLRVYVG